MSSAVSPPTRIGHIVHSSDIPIARPSPAAKPLNVIKHNSNGAYFMAAGNAKSVHLFNASTGSHIKSYEAHGYEITDLAISHDNSKFVSVGGDKPVFYWDVASAVTIRRYAGHFQKNNAVAFSADASVIISGSFDATVRLWDTKSSSGMPIQVLDEARDSITSLHVKDHQIISGSVDGKVRTYDLRKGILQTDVIGQPITSIQQSSDGQTLLVSSLDSTIRLMDSMDGAMLNSFIGHTNSSYRIPSIFGSDESYVVSGSEDGRVVLWDAVTGQVRADVLAHAGKVISGLSIHAKTNQMLTCGGDGDIVLWTS